MKPGDARHSKYRASKLADHEQRIEALEIICIDKGFMRPPTPQRRAIEFIVANQAALEELIDLSVRR